MKEQKGLLHVYCGDGKGKTTAALGLAVRARGAGFHVIVAQFLKTSDTAELAMLQGIGVEIRRVAGHYGISWTLNEEEKARLRKEHDLLLQESLKACGEGENTLLVLDELSGALETGLIDGEEALRRIAARPQALEVVVTGRNPPAALCGMADYITEMKKIRHPMDAGITARKGVEF